MRSYSSFSSIFKRCIIIQTFEELGKRYLDQAKDDCVDQHKTRGVLRGGGDPNLADVGKKKEGGEKRGGEEEGSEKKGGKRKGREKRKGKGEKRKKGEKKEEGEEDKEKRGLLQA